MPFASIPAAETVTVRDRRRVAAIVAAVLLVVAAVAIWAAVKPGSYDSSRNGCITVNLSGPMGGEVIHQCGDSAKVTCRQAFARSDQASLLIRPQCKLAGIAPGQQASVAS